MNYSLITEAQLEERIDILPASLQEAIQSEHMFHTLNEIAESHYLDEEKKETLQQLVGLVLMGFLSLSSLPEEIMRTLYLTDRVALALKNEIYEYVLKSFESDIKKVYAPIEAPRARPPLSVSPRSVDGITPVISLSSLDNTEGSSIPIRTDTSLATTSQKEEPAPFLLQKREIVAPEEKKHTPFFFSLPFRFLKSKITQEKDVRATIETSAPVKEKEEPQKVVHYTGLQTSPLSSEGDSIHFDNFLPPLASLPKNSLVHEQDKTYREEVKSTPLPKINNPRIHELDPLHHNLSTMEENDAPRIL